MNILNSCTCRACRRCPKRTKRRDAEVKQGKRRDRRAAKRGQDPVVTSLTYRA